MDDNTNNGVPAGDMPAVEPTPVEDMPSAEPMMDSAPEAPADMAASSLAASSAVPEPAVGEGATVIEAEGHPVDVVMALKHPRVVVFGNLLTGAECDELMVLARPKLERSETVDTATGGSEVNSARTSDGMFFSLGEHPVIVRLERRIAALLNWPVDRGEGLQILRYRPGTRYEPHYDYFDPEMSGTPRILERGGQRVGTLVMYLNTPERGGYTTFPDAGLEVARCAAAACSSATTGRTRPRARCTAARRCWPERSGWPRSGCAKGCFARYRARRALTMKKLITPATVQETLADYRAMGLTLGTHPLALLRGELQAWRVQTAAVPRQPGTASLRVPAAWSRTASARRRPRAWSS